MHLSESHVARDYRGELHMPALSTLVFCKPAILLCCGIEPHQRLPINQIAGEERLHELTHKSIDGLIVEP